MRRIGDAQRRVRLARRHRLAPAYRAAGPAEVAEDLVALHATDPATVFVSAAARMARPSVAAIEAALYDERSVVRMLAMRRTMFVVRAALVPIVQAACSDQVAAAERRRFHRIAEDDGFDAAWLKDAEERVLEILEDRGEAFTREITAADPRLKEKLTYARGTRHEAAISVSSRLMLILGAEGRIVRGRPRGSWTTSEYRWSAMDRWLPERPPVMSAEEARPLLARRWLAAFGPASVTDLRWWTGWTAGQTRAALTAIGPEEVELEDGGTGLVLPGDTGTDADGAGEPEPWTALLPGLDTTPMGWKERGWFLGGSGGRPPGKQGLGPHGPALFDRNGNIGPTVWWNGRIIGGWAQRGDGEIVWRLMEDAGADAVAAVEAEAARLRSWMGDARVTPRFRTPLERELAVRAD